MSEKLKRHCIFLRPSDYERLAELYPEVKTAAIIRKLIENHLAKASPPMDISSIKVKIND